MQILLQALFAEPETGKIPKTASLLSEELPGETDFAEILFAEAEVAKAEKAVAKVEEIARSVAPSAQSSDQEATFLAQPVSRVFLFDAQHEVELQASPEIPPEPGIAFPTSLPVEPAVPVVAIPAPAPNLVVSTDGSFLARLEAKPVEALLLPIDADTPPVVAEIEQGKSKRPIAVEVDDRVEKARLEIRQPNTEAIVTTNVARELKPVTMSPTDANAQLPSGPKVAVDARPSGRPEAEIAALPVPRPETTPPSKVEPTTTVATPPKPQVELAPHTDVAKNTVSVAAPQTVTMTGGDMPAAPSAARVAQLVPAEMPVQRPLERPTRWAGQEARASEAKAPVPAETATPTPPVKNAVPAIQIPAARFDLPRSRDGAAHLEGDIGLSSGADGRVHKADLIPVAKPELSARNVVSQITQTITSRANPEGLIEVRLQPEELGRVRLAMQPMEAGLAVLVTADRPETLDLMRRNIELLESDLRDQGFENLSFSFGQGGMSGQDEEAGKPPPDFEHGAAKGGGLRADITINHMPIEDGRLDIRL